MAAENFLQLITSSRPQSPQNRKQKKYFFFKKKGKSQNKPEEKKTHYLQGLRMKITSEFSSETM